MASQLWLGTPPIEDNPVARIVFSTANLLPIALGSIQTQNGDTIFLGEPSVYGSLCHSNVIFPMLFLARDRQIERIYVPVEDAKEAAMVDGAKVINTFKNLCDLADFDYFPAISGSSNDNGATTVTAQSQVTPDTMRTLVRGLGCGVAVNINIQLTVPETTDPNIYEAFFAALKKNLFPQ